MNEYLTVGLDSVLEDFPSAGVFVIGDFNKMKLNLLCSRFNLKKVVRSPTRGTNVLDQIITSMSELYNEVAHLPPIGRSDHQCLLYHPNAKENIKPCSRKVRLMKPNKLISLGVKLDQEDWNPVFNAQDIDEKVDKFTTIVTQLLEHNDGDSEKTAQEATQHPNFESRQIVVLNKAPTLSRERGIKEG